MLPLCRHHGIGVIPWSPLARGILAGSRRQNTVRAKSDTYATELYSAADKASDDAVVEAVVQVAQARGIAPARVALAWVYQQPGVVAPIVGASKPGHLEDAIAALEVKLTPDEIKAVEAPYRPHAVAGHR